MTAISLALLAAAIGADPVPLPDAKSIDTITYSFGGPFGSTGTLTITAAGKVSYRDQPGLFTTSSGGPVRTAEWDIPKADAAAFFAGLVTDGLLDLPSRVKKTDATRFTIASGKWRLYLGADPVPEKIAARVQPLLEKADPARWKKKPAAPEKTAVTSFEFSLTDKEGREVTFAVWRHGSVGYTRRRPASDPLGAGTVVSELKGIGQEEAAKILDALAADGALDIAGAGPNVVPPFHVQVFAGKWVIESRPEKLPDAVMKHIRPLLEKADPEFWK